MTLSPAKSRVAVIVNPRGGTRRALAVLDQVRPIFAASAVTLDIHTTAAAGHATNLAATLDPGDGLVVIGGDGTLHEVVNGLMRRGGELPPVGIIPAGTGNAVALDLGLADPVEAAKRVLAGKTRPLDVVRVTMASRAAYCVNIVGWGGVADINRTAERMRWLGPTRYAAAALWNIARHRRRPGRVVIDGAASDDRFLFVIGCCTRFTGSGMMVAPRADPSDGLIDVVTVRRATRYQMMQLLGRVFNGSHVRMPFVEYQQARSFAVEADGPLNLDGELTGSAPFMAEVLPAALRVYG